MKTYPILLLLATVAYAKPANRIVGGENALVHEFPYQVSLQYRDPKTGVALHFCGGTILNNSFVLTAAHCFMEVTDEEFLKDVEILAGAHGFANKSGFEQVRHVAKFVTHEGYAGGVAPHDIAVITLKTPFTFNEKVQAANLPAKDFKATGFATLSGWGYIANNPDTRPDVLQKVTMQIFDDAKCRKLWIGDKYDEKHVCAGHLGGLPSTCRGDSGSGLVQKIQGKVYVIGVDSFGKYPCGITKNKPTVFVEVAHYIDWIQKQISSK